MSGFNFKGYVTITHLNVRKQGPEEERALAIDVKVKAEGVPVGRMCGLLDAKSSADVQRAFDDGSGFLSMPGIRAIGLRADLREHHSMEIAGYKFAPSAIRNFSFEPKLYDGKAVVDLTFSFTVVEPNKNLEHFLVENVQDQPVAVVVSNEQKGLLDQPGDDENLAEEMGGDDAEAAEAEAAEDDAE